GKPPACPGGIALPKSCQSRNISYEYIGNSKRIITRYGILGLCDYYRITQGRRRCRQPWAAIGNGFAVATFRNYTFHGKPDAGELPVRFDEGRERQVGLYHNAGV
ncbi:MAG: hypothetical protein LBM04_06795, partial [Opitutaceae bacterium]|nr:hypothetical protein [Opitutaceae bacterium]